MIKISPKGDKAWVNFNFTPSVDADSVAIAADWNGWEYEEMKAKKDGSFYFRKYLPMGQQYEFRYVIDKNHWENESDAPQLNNPFGSQNSLLKL